MHLLKRTLVALATCVLVVLATGAVAEAATTPQSAAKSPCLQPPQGVDWSKQPDAVLQMYGLPTHEMLGSDPHRWANLQAVKQHSCGSRPGNGHTHLQVVGNTSSTDNWSGWWDTQGSRGVFTEADVNFYVPTVHGCGGYSHTDVSDWAGVGGVGTSPEVLVQAGVSVGANWNIVLGKCIDTVVPWYEVYPAESEQDWSFTVHQGDYAYAYIESNLSGSGYDYFFVEDDTLGTYSSTYDYTSSHLSDSMYGECILERNATNGVTNPLTDYGTDAFSNCELSGENPVRTDYIKNWSGNEGVVMIHSGTTLSQPPASLSGNSNFTMTWKAYV